MTLTAEEQAAKERIWARIVLWIELHESFIWQEACG